MLLEWLESENNCKTKPYITLSVFFGAYIGLTFSLSYWEQSSWKMGIWWAIPKYCKCFLLEHFSEVVGKEGRHFVEM